MLSHKYAKQIISFTFFSEIRLAINPEKRKSLITKQRELTLALLQLDDKKNTVDFLTLFSKDKK